MHVLLIIITHFVSATNINMPQIAEESLPRYVLYHQALLPSSEACRHTWSLGRNDLLLPEMEIVHLDKLYSNNVALCASC